MRGHNVDAGFDGPVLSVVGDPGDDVDPVVQATAFPASPGVVLTKAARQPSPRVSGGAPFLETQAIIRTIVSPHLRGWTVQAAAAGVYWFVVLANAGVRRRCGRLDGRARSTLPLPGSGVPEPAGTSRVARRSPAHAVLPRPRRLSRRRQGVRCRR